MPRPKEVRLTKDDMEAFVMEESVKAYERIGWTRADDGSSEKKPAVKKPAAKKTDEEG
jgi:hypothetical protein